ncbi:MAG: hypothetical protein RBS73_14740 [Prolixibacteraceae bacterium]|nr:hypothetical protein [Prolixibacteraceae bacterium]
MVNYKTQYMYWSSILWFLSWPALIVISYQLVKFAIKKYEAVFEDE